MGNMTNILTLSKRFNDLANELAKELHFAAFNSAPKTSLELYNSDFYFERNKRELRPYPVELDVTYAPGCIVPIEEGRLVASIDSTCIPLGYSRAGIVYAGRLSVVFSKSGHVEFYSRIGPIFSCQDISGQSSDQVESAIRRQLEEKAANTIINSGFDGILLLDGSLKNIESMDLKGYECSAVVGISKTSFLNFSDHENALYSVKYPAFSFVEEGRVSTLLAKLTADGIVFRIDVFSEREPREILGYILYNDAFYAGYPESLRLAHHLSIFNRAETIALQAVVKKDLKVRTVPSFEIRKVALGTFRRG
jgi:hypothetical protein